MTTLLELSVETISNKIEQYNDLSGLPEELVVILFQRVLEKGKLTPKVLKTFEKTKYEWLLERIKALHIRDVPPIPCYSRNSWLGDKPGLY